MQNSIKTIGNVRESRTSNFRGAYALNEPSIAYEILTDLEAIEYPEDAETEWTDVLFHDEKYYAAFGEDSLMSDCRLVYVEIEPTASMIKTVEYNKQY